MGRKDILPICFKAGSLGDDVPRRDLWISPHHAMYFETSGGVLIEAKDLVNGVSIVQAEQVDEVEYFHIELDTHDVIIAEGALSETFVDDDSRGMFHNAHEYRALYPESGRTTGALLRAAARRRLRGRGGAATRRAARRIRASGRRRMPARCAAMSISSATTASKAGRRTSTIPRRRSVSTFSPAAS